MPQPRTALNAGMHLGSSAQTWMSGCTPPSYIPVCTGEWFGMQIPLANSHRPILLKFRGDWGSQVRPLMLVDVTSPFPPSWNEGYIRNRDVCSHFCCSSLDTILFSVWWSLWFIFGLRPLSFFCWWILAMLCVCSRNHKDLLSKH